jgi:hypothetical protein
MMSTEQSMEWELAGKTDEYGAVDGMRIGR